jgi:hypothetical protein
MSYASLDEAFPAFNEGAPTKKQKKTKKFLSQPPPEPLVVEPDRPGARPPKDVEVLHNKPDENTKTTSASNFLVAAPDPAEDYFPYPLGSDTDTNAFMLQPDWSTQFAIKSSTGNVAETPIAPATPVDGYSTLWRNIPDPQFGEGDLRKKGVNGVAIDSELREKIDKIIARLDSHEYTSDSPRDTFSEILLFIFFGVLIILILDLFFRSQQNALFSAFSMSMKQRGGGALSGRQRGGQMTALLRRLQRGGFI